MTNGHRDVDGAAATAAVATSESHQPSAAPGGGSEDIVVRYPSFRC